MPHFKFNPLNRQLMHAFGGTVLTLAGLHGVHAQPSDGIERIEITGSAIKRIDAETALPVTIMKMSELRERGITSVEDVVKMISGSQSNTGTSQSVGASTGGASFASMRGIGPNKTLVLLNGRRIVNNAIEGSAPDLNAIPMAALDRIEVLRDGASSLYGTDAIGGVINFITRTNFTGGTFSADYASPQHGAGKSKGFNLGFGKGDMAEDKFNIFGFIDYKNQDVLKASDRPEIPHDGKISSTPYPGIYSQGGARFSPFAPKCDAEFNTPNGTSCTYRYANWVDLVPKTDRLSGMLKGTIDAGGGNRLELDYFMSKSTTGTNIAPVPFAALTVNPGTRFYPGNGITPAPPAGSGIDPSKPLDVRWRDVPNGPRADSGTNDQQRFSAVFKGTAGDWDYNTGLTYSTNKVGYGLVGGYTNGDIITKGVENGIINPFTAGPQDAAGAALLKSADALGPLLSAKGTTTTIDGRGSRELSDWFNAGRPAAVAVGAEFRQEQMQNKVVDPVYAAQVAASTGIDPSTNNVGSRNIMAFYGELNVPVRKSLDVTAAVRYDKYSDFGSTINPKVSFRWQPSSVFLMRGSASTGFRAPSLYDLHASKAYTTTAGVWDDPKLCPGGTAVAGADANAACGNQFQALRSGTSNLKPETSQSTTFGLLLQPNKDLDLSVDFWWIKLNNQINYVPESTVFGNPTKYASYFQRAPDGTLSFDGTQCPGSNCGYIDQSQRNLGGVETKGVDFMASYTMRLEDMGSLNFRGVGTLVNQYDYQNVPDGPWLNNLGGFYKADFPIVKWQSTLSVTWKLEMLTLGLASHYKAGYQDQDGERNVSPYITWDTYGSYAFSKNASLTFGVRNLFDKAPPVSVQTQTFQVGYDPRLADPFMRTFYARGAYQF
jgi:iron complex outermembrane receptor protein